MRILALIIIFAGVIYAQPISWLEKYRIPRWLALIIVVMGLIVLVSGFSFLIGGTLSSFSGNLSKYESTLTSISNSFIQFLNEKGLMIPKDQISNLVQPAKILEFTVTALNQLFNMMGTTFL